MLPVVLDCAEWPILLVGAGPPALRRLATLDAAGCRNVTVFGPGDDPALRGAAGPRHRDGLPGEAEIAACRLLFVAGLAGDAGAGLAALARCHRVPVNVEDERPHCDFHMPAMVRRGALLLTVSTAGASPALAARLRGWLEARFGPEWGNRLERAGALRDRLRAAGRGSDVTSEVNAMADREGWLA